MLEDLQLAVAWEFDERDLHFNVLIFHLPPPDNAPQFQRRFG